MEPIAIERYAHIVFFTRAVARAIEAIRGCDLFLSIGTSGVFYPAAGFPRFAKEKQARCLEINPAANEMSSLYDEAIRAKAGEALPGLFP